MTPDEETRAELMMDLAKACAEDMANACHRAGLFETADVISVLGAAHAIACAYAIGEQGANAEIIFETSARLLRETCVGLGVITGGKGEDH